jgi:hypothetical protein
MLTVIGSRQFIWAIAIAKQSKKPSSLSNKDRHTAKVNLTEMLQNVEPIFLKNLKIGKSFWMGGWLNFCLMYHILQSINISL